MSKEIILLMHPAFGVLAILSAVWVFVEVLNARTENQSRIKTASWVLAVFVWLSYLVGGYWYVNYYGADKAIIKAGPWPFAHTFSMETKEHLFFVLLLIGTYVPMVATANQVLSNKGARNLLMTLTVLVVLLGLAMEGAGATIGIGVKLGLLAGR